eukprot:GHVS01109042.1.p1 GENE.GHVS01109042.1~~GHVS01109042.1.p1  ORF type:complete len:186 (-),score=28.04 GHVS01109042.1:113-670(-)
MNTTESMEDQAHKIEQCLKGPLTGVLCLSGGFAAGNSKDELFLASAHRMLTSSVCASLVAVNIAAHHMKEGGLLVLPGAAAACVATPGMISYGAAKAYIHHLVSSLAQTGSGMPKDAKVVGLAPVTLDTPANRAAMPTADTSTWTPLGHLSGKLVEWTARPDLLVSGHIYKIETLHHTTEYANIL